MTKRLFCVILYRVQENALARFLLNIAAEKFTEEKERKMKHRYERACIEICASPHTDFLLSSIEELSDNNGKDTFSDWWDI